MFAIEYGWCPGICSSATRALMPSPPIQKPNAAKAAAGACKPLGGAGQQCFPQVRVTIRVRPSDRGPRVVAQFDVLHVAEQPRRVSIADRATADDVPVRDDTHPRPLTFDA